MNQNYEKYFFKPKTNWFEKNLKIWKDNCDDYKNYTQNITELEIYLFYHHVENKCQHPECDNQTEFVSITRGFKETF
jgi:hypothetical protein